eukprot:509111-Pyramimonas_sp.AAC.1
MYVGRSRTPPALGSGRGGLYNSFFPNSIMPLFAMIAVRLDVLSNKLLSLPTSTICCCCHVAARLAITMNIFKVKSSSHRAQRLHQASHRMPQGPQYGRPRWLGKYPPSLCRHWALILASVAPRGASAQHGRGA